MYESNFTSSEINLARHSPRDIESYILMEKDFEKSKLKLFNKLEAFPRFTTKRSLSRFLAKHEIFKKVVAVNGIVIECGVFNGVGYLHGHNYQTYLSLQTIIEKLLDLILLKGFHLWGKKMEIVKNDII